MTKKAISVYTEKYKWSGYKWLYRENGMLEDGGKEGQNHLFFGQTTYPVDSKRMTLEKYPKHK